MKIVIMASLAALAWSGLALALPWPGSKGSAGGGAASLQAGVQRWKNMQQCMDELSAQLPIEAASQLIGSDPLEVICAGRQAAAKDDPGICEREVKDYSQRSNCLRFFAIYSGRPQDCPKRGWPLFHEGLCVALASRQPSLCLAAPYAKQPLCRAILLSEGLCGSLPAARQSRCRHEAATWRRLLKAQRPALPADFAPTLEVRVITTSSGLNLPASASQLRSALLDQGLLLAEQEGNGDALCLDRNFAPRDSYDYSVRSALDLEIAVPLPSGGIGTVSVGGSTGVMAKVSFYEPSNYHHHTMHARSGKVILTKLERSLAGQVEGTFSIEFTDGLDTLKLEGKFRSFVRELVPLSVVATYVSQYVGKRYTSDHQQGYLSPDEVKRYQARIVKRKDGVYDVDTSVHEELQRNTRKLTDSVSFGQDANTQRFRLYAVPRTSPLGLLGFQDNDVISRINGLKIESMEDFYEAYAKIKRSSSIVVVIERGGSETTLTYRIKKVLAKKSG